MLLALKKENKKKNLNRKPLKALSFQLRRERHRDRDRHTDRDRNIRRDRERQRDRDRQADRQKQRERDLISASAVPNLGKGVGVKAWGWGGVGGGGQGSGEEDGGRTQEETTRLARGKPKIRG